ncbi:transcriptional regulator SplA domain-containing protein [Sediminibacillus albus]|nr:transcriptional regulator SplA domain-containing protein [Sediminibacillus albus]
MEYNQGYMPGEVVYVIIRNPHVQGVANVQEAAVVADPNHAGDLALFLYDTYYPLTEEVAVYRSEQEAEFAYQSVFGDSEEADFHG